MNHLNTVRRFTFLLIIGSALVWASDDSCINCHQNPEFLVTNKKLYDYFQNWRASTHGQEEVTCIDCHGGDNKAKEKAKAHGSSMNTDKNQSAVHFQNIPGTCGECHDSFLVAYKESKHFAQLIDKGESEQGPNCVTCHGSLTSAKPVVTTVHEVCQQCHNIVSKIGPDIPNQAVTLLNDLNAIRGYRRYITKRADPQLAKPILKQIDDQIAVLAEHWHRFELETIDKDTTALLIYCRQERDKIRKLAKEKKRNK